MKLTTLILAAALPLSALAQSQKVPDSVLDDFARDLTGLQRAVMEARRQQEAQMALLAQQPLSVNTVMITSPSATVHVGAASNSARILEAKKGSSFKVLDKAGDWYAISLPGRAQGLDAGWVNAAEVVPSFQKMSGTEQPAASLMDPIIRKLAEQAAQVKEKWNNNPYVSITGFSIGLVPPDLSLNFEFKP